MNVMLMNSGPKLKIPLGDNWVSVLRLHMQIWSALIVGCEKAQEMLPSPRWLLSQGSVNLSSLRIKVLDETDYSSTGDIYYFGEENGNWIVIEL